MRKSQKVPEHNVETMRFHVRHVRCYSLLKPMSSTKLLFLVTCTSFAISFIWMHLVSTPEQSAVTERLIEEAIENVAKDVRYPEIYRKLSNLAKNLQNILLWTVTEYAPFYYFKEGQRAFIDNNCSVINCYVTDDRKYFNGDVTKFNVIAFNGRNLRKSVLPKHRSPHQKYIYFNTESSDNSPVCNRKFNDFFNLTATYKIDSDIPTPYILITDSQKIEIGPKLDMKWADDLSEVNKSFVERLMKKTKAAAWFVSNCNERSGRNSFFKILHNALKAYGHRIDVYGSCGQLKCPSNKKDECGALLEKYYFFYMSLENSLSEDYVTEKVLTALKHNTIPIVYGGSDYSRFLPPGSYINGRNINIYALAAIMDRLMKSPTIYKQFFRWKSQYSFSDPGKRKNVCKVCAALNNKDLMEKISTYKNFLGWWNPNYKDRCWRIFNYL